MPWLLSGRITPLAGYTARAASEPPRGQSGSKLPPSTIAPRSCNYASRKRLQIVVQGEIAQVSEQLQDLLAKLRGRFEVLYDAVTSDK